MHVPAYLHLAVQPSEVTPIDLRDLQDAADALLLTGETLDAAATAFGSLYAGMHQRKSGYNISLDTSIQFHPDSGAPDSHRVELLTRLGECFAQAHGQRVAHRTYQVGECWFYAVEIEPSDTVARASIRLSCLLSGPFPVAGEEQLP